MIFITFLLILPIIVTLGVSFFRPPSKEKYVLMILAIIVLFVILSFPYWAVNILHGSRVLSTEAMIELFSASLDSFNKDIGRYPTTDEGLSALVTPPQTISRDRWMGPYLAKGVPKDAWGHDFVYISNTANEFRLFSCGFDGTTKSGGNDKDDINNWDNKKTWQQFYAAQRVREKRIENINRSIVLYLYPALIIFLLYRLYRFRRDNSSRKKVTV